MIIKYDSGFGPGILSNVRTFSLDFPDGGDKPGRLMFFEHSEARQTAKWVIAIGIISCKLEAADYKYLKGFDWSKG